MIDPRVASGLRDLPPAVTIPRERMLESFRKVFASFGFVPIETPHIERMEVLTGKGAGSDEVLRQIFDVTNKGGTPGELALRFDLTVPLARFVAKHVDELGVPFKRYAIGSVFRGERPAKGRFREFMQCDFDTVGTESVVADAETAQVIHAALSAVGCPSFTIALNNRRIIDGVLKKFNLMQFTGPVLKALDKLDKIGQEAFIDVLDKEARLSYEVANIFLNFVNSGRNDKDLKYARSLLDDQPEAMVGILNLERVLELLHQGGVPLDRIKIDMGLVRGLDYYTGIVYETTVNGWEKFGSIASGGRYDNLASLFTSRRLPGVGASIGLDRLLALMDEAGLLPSSGTTAPILVVNFPGGNLSISMNLAARLRARGLGTEVFPDQIPLGKQLGYGSARGHKLAVIVGPDEEAKHVFNLRNLTTRQEQKGLPFEALESTVHAALQAMGDAARGETTS